jgi:hypothetical protein
VTNTLAYTSTEFIDVFQQSFTYLTEVEVTDSDKHSSLLLYGFNYDRKKVLQYRPGACIMKLITTVIYGFP